jgi:hypothetical protein
MSQIKQSKPSEARLYDEPERSEGEASIVPTSWQHLLLLLILGLGDMLLLIAPIVPSSIYWPIGQSKHTHKILSQTIGVLFRMSPKGRHKPLHRRIEIIRSFKMTRLMLEQIRAACDENDISFSQLMREAVNQSLSRCNQRREFLQDQTSSS